MLLFLFCCCFFVVVFCKKIIFISAHSRFRKRLALGEVAPNKQPHIPPSSSFNPANSAAGSAEWEPGLPWAAWTPLVRGVARPWCRTCGSPCVCVLELRALEPEKRVIAARPAIICGSAGHAFVCEPAAAQKTPERRRCCAALRCARGASECSAKPRCALTRVDNRKVEGD